MKTYKVCVVVSTYTANYITLEAENEDAASMMANQKWYDFGSDAFSSKCLEESVIDIEVEQGETK